MEIDINLFFTVIASGVTFFLGAIVFLHDRISFTNKLFIIHSLIGTAWAVVNYVSLIASPEHALFWIRLVMFFASPYVFLFFLFVKNFPSPILVMNKRYFFGFIALMFVMAILTLSPYVFEGVSLTERSSTQVVPQPGVAMPVFALVLVIFFLSSFVLVLKKYFESKELIKKQWLSIGFGLITTYTLLIFFVFLRVAIFNDTSFVPYSPLFILPIFIGSAYAILKHHLFSIKVISAEIITFSLLLANIFQVILSGNILSRVLSLGSTIFLLIFGILLIKSVLKEVEQKEQLEELAKELQAANKKLEELSAYKTQLLSLASHQTKSPLAAIKSYASLMVQGLFGEVNDQVKDKLRKIMLAADELLALIDTFLNLRKVEEGRMDYKLEKTDLVDLVKQKAEELQPLTQSKNLGYEIQLPDHPIMVNADAQKLQQVLQNFIDNAIKYTPQGKVTINLKEEGGNVVFSVHDSGYGIPAELLPHLFEEYVRDERIKNKVRGTGFGLFIAKKITEAHGGKIWAESEGENKGSTFYLKLKKVDNS